MCVATLSSHIMVAKMKFYIPFIIFAAEKFQGTPKKEDCPKKKNRKPHRPCLYCSAMRSRLTDHLKKKHTKESDVKAAMRLPQQDRDRAFAALRKKGILKANMKLLKTEKQSSPVKLIRERRRGSDNVLYCSKCYTFVSKQYFHRHRRLCYSNETSVTAPEGIPSVFCCVTEISEEFKKEILISLYQDEVGKICTSDKLILGFGCREFNNMQQKKDKKDEKKASLRTDMRILGRLYKRFEEICTEKKIECDSSADMFERKNFKSLEATIIDLCARGDGGSKAGLKLSIGYLLKKVSKYIHGECLITGKEDEALQIERFLAVLNFHWKLLFGDAEYSITMRRQTQLRKPNNLPDKDEICKLREFTVSKVRELSDDAFVFMTQNEFSLLRDLVVCRLTLFNARRGGEPSRLVLSEWKDADNNEWIGDVQSVKDPLEKHLLGRYKLAYQPGKRDKLVPLLIIDDCWKALNLLCDPDIRKQASVDENNKYVFPNTQLSPLHVTGWHAVKKCCELAGLDNHVTATSVRHYVATIYASFEVPEADRKIFFNHLGHSESINLNVYQSPPAVKEVTKVGKFLDLLDKGKC